MIKKLLKNFRTAQFAAPTNNLYENSFRLSRKFCIYCGQFGEQSFTIAKTVSNATRRRKFHKHLKGELTTDEEVRIANSHE